MNILTKQDQQTLNNHYQDYLHTLQQQNILQQTLAPLEGVDEWLDQVLDEVGDRIELGRDQAATSFVRSCLRYFGEAYGVAFAGGRLWGLISERAAEDARDLSVPLISVDEVVQELFAWLGDRSLGEVAVAQLKDEFEFRLVDRPVQRGRVVRLPRFLEFSSVWLASGQLRLSGESSGARWLVLQRVISHFEDPNSVGVSSSVEASLPVPYPHRDVLLHERVLQGLERVSSVTPYKNGSVAIKFPSEALAVEFMEYFAPEE